MSLSQSIELQKALAAVPPQHRLQFMSMLEQRLRGAVSKEEELYERLPVDVEHFMLSPYYLDKSEEVYPVVLEELKQINNGKYVEVVFTGGIGSAKTSTALYTLAYQLYLLSCMKNPHKVFGLDRSTEILFIFQNINKTLAKGVDYERFRAMIAHSPYFKQKFPFEEGLESQLVFPNRIKVVPVGGTETGAIGQNVIGGLIDELNYMAVIEKSKLAVDGQTYDQAITLYNSIARRRKSRFSQQGKLPGILCLVSSKKYPGEFTDKKIEEARTDPTIYVYDKRIWDVKPWAYGPERFFVFVGDEHRKPRILSEKENVSPEDRDLVDAIPLDYRADFERDIINALREIAGRSTLARFPYMINAEAVASCFKRHASIFSRPDCDFRETKLKIYPAEMWRPDIPRFAHVDLGLSSDSAGVCIGTVVGFTQVKRREVDGSKEFTEWLPKIRIDGVLEVKPPKGDEIQFAKIREVFYLLRSAGLNLKWVTYDSFQSVDSVQILRQKGFITGFESMDTNPMTYDLCKTALYDGRVDIPDVPKLLRELVSLERDPKKGKVDHPPRGSKDLADALAGVVYGCTMRREFWNFYKIPLNELPLSVREASRKAKVEEEARKVHERQEKAAEID